MSYARNKVRTHVRERGYSIGVPLRGAPATPPPPPLGLMDTIAPFIMRSVFTEVISISGCLYIFINSKLSVFSNQFSVSAAKVRQIFDICKSLPYFLPNLVYFTSLPVTSYIFSPRRMKILPSMMSFMGLSEALIASMPVAVFLPLTPIVTRRRPGAGFGSVR